MEKGTLEIILELIIAGQNYLWDSRSYGNITDEEFENMNKRYILMKDLLSCMIKNKKGGNSHDV